MFTIAGEGNFEACPTMRNICYASAVVDYVLYIFTVSIQEVMLPLLHILSSIYCRVQF